MTTDEKQININAGLKLFGAPHTIVELDRESLSVIPEKTDKELYAQPAEEDKKNDQTTSGGGSGSGSSSTTPSGGEDQSQKKD